jgi:hypothetical protein
MAAVWQSVDIRGEIPANATTEPCRPIASITMRAMNWRFMTGILTPDLRLRSQNRALLVT